MFARLASFALRRRKLVLVVTVLLFALAIAGAIRLRLDFSSASFYGDADARIAELRSFHAEWGVDDDLLLVVARTPTDSTGTGMLAAARMDELAALGAELRASPHVRRVVSIAELPVRPRPPPSPPFVPGLLSVDGSKAVIVVEISESSDDLEAVVPVVAEIDAIVARHRRPGVLELELAGIPAIRAAFFALTVRDQTRFVPITLLLIAGGLWLAFRSRPGVWIPGVAAGLPLVLLLGVMGWLGEPLGLLNQAYMTLIPVLSVSAAIHLVARVRERLAEIDSGAALDPARAQAVVVAACGQVGLACFLSTTTTALGFASLAVARMPILRNFGLYAALGLLFSLATVTILLPALLSWADPVRLRGHRSVRPPRLLAACAHLAVTRPWAVLAVAVLLTCASAWACTRVVVDNRLGALLHTDHPARAASELVDRELGGTLALEIDVRGDFASAPDREQLAAFMRWADEQPEHRVVLGPGRDPTPRVSPDHQRAWLTLRTGDLGGRRFEEVAERARREFAATAPSLSATMTGTALVAYAGVNRITDDLVGSLLLAFVVIVGLIGVLFRSLRFALVSIFPNALPMVMALAVLGLAQIPLDPLGAVILTMALGVAVDDTIHLMATTRDHLRSGVDLASAATAAITSTGRASAMTTGLIVSGLAINLLSSFPPLALVGLLGGLVLVFALLADLLILPASLMISAGKRRRD